MLDDVIVPRGAAMDQVGYAVAVDILLDDLFQALPEGEGAALAHPGAGGAGGVT